MRDYGKALSAVHHLNLAHGLGALAVHDTLGERAKVSVTLNLSACVAQSDSEADRMAKHRNDLLSNEVFLGPMLDGAYDPEIFDVTTDYTDWSFIRDDDLKTIRQPVQCLGINYYSSTHVKGVTDPAECERRRNDHMQAVPAQDIVDALPPEGELTDMGWNQEPRVLTEMLVGLAKRYPGLDLMVTENGSAWKDEVTEDSSAPGGRIIHDPKRVAYLNHHIRAIADASRPEFRWSVILHGHCWIISNGPSDIRSDSALSVLTMRRRSVSGKIRHTGIVRSSRKESDVFIGRRPRYAATPLLLC